MFLSGMSFLLSLLTIFRPSKPLSKLSIVHHIQNLEKIWSTSTAPAAVLLVVDRATDFTWDSVFNFFVYGRLWYQRNLEMLVVTAFGADHSAFNFIERAWGAVTKMVAGLQLPNILPGESACPQCSNLPPDKEHQVCLLVCLLLIVFIENLWASRRASKNLVFFYPHQAIWWLQYRVPSDIFFFIKYSSASH